jgi:hypothetical protein
MLKKKGMGIFGPNLEFLKMNAEMCVFLSTNVRNNVRTEVSYSMRKKM